MRSMRGGGLLLAVVVACGRVSFDPLAGDALGDGATGACIVDISGGHSHQCALLGDGMVRCWGDNVSNQLGDGSSVSRATPDLVRNFDGTPLDDVIQISAGVETNTCALRRDRTGWCWGNNSNAQLGDGSLSNQPNPVQVQVDDILEIRTGEQHTCARRGDGSLWCWGLADFGRLGNTGTGPQLGASMAPVTDVASVITSWGHTCALTNSGTLYCWGYNANGQLANGDNTSTPTPQQIATSNVNALSSAWRATCVASGGTAYCAGNNMYGELGNGTMTNSTVLVPMRDTTGAVFDRVVALGTGDVHGCAIRDDRTVWCWGDNGMGQLGRAGGDSLYPLQIALRGPVVKLAVGNFHACAALADDTMQCWGSNVDGQLGDGTMTTPTSPITVPLTCPL